MAQILKKVEMMNLNEAYQKVLCWFFSFPDIETGLNDLSSGLKISKTTAKRIISVLIEEGFLQKKVYGKTWRITCNKDHPYNFSRKTAFNLSMVCEAYWSMGLRELILQRVGSPLSIILFGSYRKGDDTEKSDIDLAVEVSDGEGVRIEPLGMIGTFGFRQNVPVNMHIFSRNNIDLNLFSNIANGIVLEGFLEVRP